MILKQKWLIRREFPLANDITPTWSIAGRGWNRKVHILIFCMYLFYRGPLKVSKKLTIEVSKGCEYCMQ